MQGRASSRAGLPLRLAAVAGVLLLAACSVPPLRRSVVVEPTATATPAPAGASHAGGTVADGHYTVVRGDTMYSIAFRAGVDYRELAAWNGIAAPYVIHPGQRLRLSGPPVAPPSAPLAAAQPPVFEPVPSTPAATAPTPAAPASTVVAVAGAPAPVAAPADAPPSTPVASVPAGATRLAAGIRWRWPADGALLKPFDASDAIPGIDIAGGAGDPVRAAADGVVVYSGNGLVGYGELVIIKHNDDYLSAYGHNSERLVKEGEHVKAGQVIAK
ncbi:MAG TPA: peptidoglycan DD-metalloendopeptidase family protein, partial [Rhodanobacteraceae bacterium]|nr:peptidoglycan DD-metalloendopeptidase family protein [Rhodanobacteraceae bacterium]